MKVSEMNAHQFAMYQEMDYWMCEEIGGAENAMEDYKPGSEEYENAKKFLEQGHDELAKYFYNRVMSCCQEHAKFAGSDFLKERIERRLNKWGY